MRSDWMSVPNPENESESTDGEVDPFEELGVQANLSNVNVSDGLEAFMDDDEEEPVDSNPVVEVEDEEDEDDDVFATMGVAGPAVALASSGENDILAAFMDEDDEVDEETAEEDEGAVPESPAQPDAKDAYRMVLETVWVDGVLDPGEVNLLARKREDLGISFDEHLAIVRDMLG